MRRAILTALLCLAPIAAFAEKRPRPAPLPPSHAGVTTRVFHPKENRDWRGGKHELDVTVWYPAPESAVETPQWIGPPSAPLLSKGSAAADAPLVAGPRKLPLIVLSHGTGGSADQMAWLGTALARAGFIVAAVNHPGNNGDEPYTAQGFVLWWERATDLSEVITGMLADEALGPRIDTDRIGAAGFSIGGYTVMELAGARTDLSVYYDECRAHTDLAWCHVPEMKAFGPPPTMLETARKTSGVSLARSGESYADDRIHAVFAISPAIEEVLTPESLKAIRMPIDVVVGNADPIAPARFNGDYLRAHVRGLRETVLPGGVAHYTFLDTCTAAGKEKLGVYCADEPGVDRDKVHEQVAGMAVGFFKRELQVE
jgi:predicted dienelactone hydrolase